jgi:hypothetical protein
VVRTLFIKKWPNATHANFRLEMPFECIRACESLTIDPCLSGLTLKSTSDKYLFVGMKDFVVCVVVLASVNLLADGTDERPSVSARRGSFELQFQKLESDQTTSNNRADIQGGTGPNTGFLELETFRARRSVRRCAHAIL